MSVLCLSVRPECSLGVERILWVCWRHVEFAICALLSKLQVPDRVEVLRVSALLHTHTLAFCECLQPEYFLRFKYFLWCRYAVLSLAGCVQGSFSVQQLARRIANSPQWLLG